MNHLSVAMCLAVFVSSVSAAQPPSVGLPRVALELFPSAAREAIAPAYREAEMKPLDASAVGALAMVLHAWEQWDAAHQAYGVAQSLAPRTFEWHYLDALVLQRLARYSETADQLRRATTLSPDYLPAGVKLAEALFEAGALVKSRVAFETLARNAATEPMGQFGLGRAAASEGRHEKAVEHFRRAIALFPSWGAAHYALALSYRALGRPADAQQALAQHAQHGPQWPALDDPVLAGVAAVRDDARATLRRGIALADAGDLRGAIEAHESALARDPALAPAHINLISLYGRTGQWAQAEGHYKSLLALNTEIGNAHYDFGVLLGLQQRWDDAIAAYQRALATNPHHARAHNNYGEALERTQDHHGALEQYRRAVGDEPGLRIARFNLARMLVAAGKTDEAIGELEKLIEPRDAETPRYLFGLAAAHMRAGRRAEAVKWASEAQRLAADQGQSELAAAIHRDLVRLK